MDTKTSGMGGEGTSGADTVVPAVAVDRIKDATDMFIEEFGDEWPLELVKFAHDDGGRVLEIFLPDPRAEAMRLAIPPKYKGFATVIIACPEGWGKGISSTESTEVDV